MDDVARVLAALANPQYEWRTIDGVNKETGLEPSRILQIIESMPDQIIRSRVPDAQGRALYTTRQHYMKTHSPIQRFVITNLSTST